MARDGCSERADDSLEGLQVLNPFDHGASGRSCYQSESEVVAIWQVRSNTSLKAIEAGIKTKQPGPSPSSTRSRSLKVMYRPTQPQAAYLQRGESDLPPMGLGRLGYPLNRALPASPLALGCLGQPRGRLSDLPPMGLGRLGRRPGEALDAVPYRGGHLAKPLNSAVICPDRRGRSFHGLEVALVQRHGRSLSAAGPASS